MNWIYRTIGTTKQNIHQRLTRSLYSLEEEGQLRAVIGQIRDDHRGDGGQKSLSKNKAKNNG
jgi:hypothetical protein